MLAFLLHATLGYYPHLDSEVDFVPPRVGYLAAPSGIQNDEFEGLGAHSSVWPAAKPTPCILLARTQALHEFRKLSISHRGAMLRLVHFRHRRQQFTEIVAPQSRIFAAAVLPRFGVSKNQLDTGTYFLCGRWPEFPKCRTFNILFQHPHDYGYVDVLDRQLTDDRIDPLRETT